MTPVYWTGAGLDRAPRGRTAAVSRALRQTPADYGRPLSALDTAEVVLADVLEAAEESSG